MFHSWLHVTELTHCFGRWCHGCGKWAWDLFFCFCWPGICMQWNRSGTSRVRRGHPASGRPEAEHQQVPEAGWTGPWWPDQGTNQRVDLVVNFLVQFSYSENTSSGLVFAFNTVTMTSNTIIIASLIHYACCCLFIFNYELPLMHKV